MKLIILKKKNFHLGVSIAIIIPVAIVYGLLPNGILSEVFQFNTETINSAGIFRAIMGLYMAMAMFWFTGISKPQWWKAATMVNVLFMLGLAGGRIVSIVLDGLPSAVFLIGLGVEIVLGIWGIINLKKYE